MIVNTVIKAIMAVAYISFDCHYFTEDALKNEMR
jgi:hypothetical protein